MKFAETFGAIAFIIRARVEGLRDIGSCMSPFNAFLFLQGVETLGMRMDRHLANTLAVAKYLEKHKHVSWVKYPSLPSSPYYGLAQKYRAQGRRRGVFVRDPGRLRSREEVHRQL